MSVHPITRSELWVAQIVLFVAIGLQILVRWISHELSIGPEDLIIATEIALALFIGFTASKRHLAGRSLHRSISVVLIALISLANISSFILVAKSLVVGNEVISGYQLLASAIAIFLTNVIVFALWYWEIDSPGLTGHKWSKHDKDFQFVQQDLKEDFRDWQPQLSDYLYLSLTNASSNCPANARPLTHQANLLMGTQALITVFTLALIIARSVSILGT